LCVLRLPTVPVNEAALAASDISLTIVLESATGELLFEVGRAVIPPGQLHSGQGPPSTDVGRRGAKRHRGQEENDAAAANAGGVGEAALMPLAKRSSAVAGKRRISEWAKEDPATTRHGRINVALQQQQLEQQLEQQPQAPLGEAQMEEEEEFLFEAAAALMSLASAAL
jgi:hypothetical protein